MRDPHSLDHSGHPLPWHCLHRTQSSAPHGPPGGGASPCVAPPVGQPREPSPPEGAQHRKGPAHVGTRRKALIAAWRRPAAQGIGTRPSSHARRSSPCRPRPAWRAGPRCRGAAACCGWSGTCAGWPPPPKCSRACTGGAPAHGARRPCAASAPVRGGSRACAPRMRCTVAPATPPRWRPCRSRWGSGGRAAPGPYLPPRRHGNARSSSGSRSWQGPPAGAPPLVRRQCTRCAAARRSGCPGWHEPQGRRPAGSARCSLGGRSG
mmetsp:Transcript_32657/g.82314  ORF Transcript_32657/g.82314 Transcript_32657/m.82314 type:complete len:264 (-) Transcript_32657:356-1147(-)